MACLEPRGQLFAVQRSRHINPVFKSEPGNQGPYPVGKGPIHGQAADQSQSPVFPGQAGKGRYQRQYAFVGCEVADRYECKGSVAAGSVIDEGIGCQAAQTVSPRRGHHSRPRPADKGLNVDACGVAVENIPVHRSEIPLLNGLIKQLLESV